MKKLHFAAIALTSCMLALTLTGCGKTTLIDVTTNLTEDGTVIVYTYSDGTTKEVTIPNGKDGQNGKDGSNGEDGQSATVEDFYQTWLDRNALEDTTENYNLFLKEYLDLTQNITYTTDVAASVQQSLLCTAQVSCDYVYKLSSVSIYGGQLQSQTSYETALQTGSAVIWSVEDDYTYLVTNYHVVYCDPSSNNTQWSTYQVFEQENGSAIYPKNIYCYLYGSDSAPALDNPNNTKNATYKYTELDYGDYGVECTLVGGSITADLAVLRANTADLKRVNREIQSVELADDYYAGQTVYTIGNPLGIGMGVTQGVISADNENISLQIDDTTRTYRSIRMDTYITNGNSGGGLFNVEGQLVGISNAGKGTSNQSLNYAIPLDIVRTVVPNLIDNNGAAQKPLLGITVQSQNAVYRYNAQKQYGKIYEDVVVYEVNAGSIAQQIGIAAGDIIRTITIDGAEYEILRSFSISDALFACRAGSALSITVERGSETKTLEYTLKADDLTAVE